ncbi:hypothetical protein PLESTB_000803500 [Pleodorina starrii]|uniref:Uncharacterized protein n=2 Tax=Pleodorina starrii TaxID=330485 RepID=A0A9W6BLD2_9CHLO|nr:hypothetical protein PLESTB_000803500 [Pleodorina starrii]GLC75398.1 hypothetical protein PLESTF_001632500 [Pleodorina starrii]
MPPPASLGSAAEGAANAAAGGGGSGGGAGPSAVQDPGRLPPQLPLPLPPPPPDDLPALRLLQQGDLFGGSGAVEVPLLVPLTNGAVTNISFDESYGEPQEALIERYLTLMGLAPQQQQQQQQQQPPADPQAPAQPQQQQQPPAETPAAAAAAPARSGAVAVSFLRPGAAAPDPNLPGSRSPGLDGAAKGGGADADQEKTAAAAEAEVEAEAEEDDDLVLSHRRQQRRQQRQQAAAARALLSSSALAALGLDRPALARRGIPEALIGALHRGLAAHAAAFFRTCLAEQRRLVALTRGSGPSVPLADRLLAFITGTEEHLKSGSSLPDLVDLRNVKDTQAVLDAVSPPRAAPTPFHHELLHQRQQQQQQSPQSLSDQQHQQQHQHQQQQPPPEEPPLTELLDLDKVTALASAGNVPGLRALMRSLVSAADYTRTSLQQRLAAEGERAQRECARAQEARQAADKLREQLAARNTLLAERGAELEAACRRASTAEEALVTERSTVAGLRGQLRQLTADYEAQHRQLRAGLEAHLTRPASAKLLAAALSQPLHGSHSGTRTEGAARSSGPPGSHSGASVSDSELHSLGSQLASTRAELALAELSCQQERAAARQLRVMLDSSRATVDLHVGRAAAAAAEVERLNRLAAASEDLASAKTGGMAQLEQQLAQEKAAHRRTTERLQSSAWKFEQARSCVVDVRARAAHNLRKLQTALADVNLRAVTAERQYADASVELRQARSELEAATNTLAALRDRITRLEEEMEVLRDDAVAARLDSKEVSDKLTETQATLRNAEARVAQMQQKVMEDADTVLAGRMASQRLEVLEKEHDELQTAYRSLRDAHDQLSQQHAALQAEMAATRVRVSELEVKEARLEELTAAHEELKAAKSRVDQQYAGTLKAKALLSSELAGLKKHADVLAEQVQEYRRQSDGARLALEEEKDMHRHTREELSMTATRRDELETRCEDLKMIVEGMEERMKASDAEVSRCRRTAELAGHQRAEAFAMRDAMSKVRMALTCDIKEYLASIDGQVRQMMQCLEGLKDTLTAVQSRLLDLDPATLDGTATELPKVPYEESQKMIDALFKMVTHGSQLLDTQSEIRKTLAERVEQLEDGIKDRLGTATDYWRQVLVLSRGSPRSMVQMVEHMTGQACKDLDLDPVNPLSRMVPMGVLEEAGIQLNTQFERVGMLRERADVSKAKGDAAGKLLEYERQVSSARAAEFQSLVDSLSREVNRLKARVGSLEANNVMQQRATADMQRMLNDAEWKVAKAQEREALLGIKFMVPHGRETKAVQTVFSDLYMMTSVSSLPPGISPSPSLPFQPSGPMGQLSTAASATAARSQQQLLQARSLGAPDMAAIYEAEELLGGGEEAAEYGVHLAAAAAAAAAGADAPGSPASLPPLSALNSPSVHAATGPWVGPRNSQQPGAVLTRPQSNLSRASSALPPAPPPLRCTSPDLLPAADGSGGGGAAATADGGPQPPRTAFMTPYGSEAMPGGRGASTGGGSGGGRPPPPHQRRRHPDELPRRSGGSVLSPVPSLNSLHSTNSVASDGAAAGGGGGGGGTAMATDRGYTSDGNALEAGSNSDDEGFLSPSPSTSPPLMLLRTPSVTATAAAAAAFAAAKSGGAPSMQHIRPATAGPPSGPWTHLHGAHSTGGIGHHPHSHHHHAHQIPHAHSHHAHHAARLSGAVLHSTRPASSAAAAAPPTPSPPTPSGIPHSWQHTPWDWLSDVAPLTRSGGGSGGGAVPYSRQALLEIIADIHYTKGLHDQVAAAAAFPATSMQQYIGAYFEARHGPRGGSPPNAEMALAQLLVSLEVHSALYEVMLFARVAGLQTWTGKVPGRNGASRPTTAQSIKASVGGGFAPRPRTPRDPGGGSVSPYPSGALSPSRPGTASPVPVTTRNSRTLSARNSMAAAAAGGGGGGPLTSRNSLAMGGGGGGIPTRGSMAPPGGGPPLLGLVPSSRPGTAPSPPPLAADGADLSLQPAAAAASGGGGETVMRLRTGMSPAIISTHGPYSPPLQNGRGGGGAGPPPPPPPVLASAASVLPPAASPLQPPPPLLQPSLQLGGSLQLQLQLLQPQLSVPPPKPQLRIRPELLVSEQLSSLLGRLGEVSGMEALAQFVNTGRLLGRLRPADLGRAVPEEAHPELYFTVQRVCGALGLQDAPELLVRQSLPYGADVMLLQLPNVATSALGLLAQGDVDRQPVPYMAAAPSAAAGGWRRRAVLLLTPGLVAAAAPAAFGVGPGSGSGSPLDGEELQALLGAALAPIAMPGGAGWRFDVQSGTGGSATSGTSGGSGVVGAAGSGGGAGGPGSVAAPGASSASGPASASTAAASAAAGSPPTLLSAAEVITAVNVAALKPRAVTSVLPSQLQFKWERLLTHLRGVAAAATAAADRGALLATQNMAAAVRAVFRAAAGVSVQDGAQALGNGEELLLQAQTMPLSDEQLLGMATMAMHDAAADGGETRRGYALARVAALTRWAETPEYRQTLRSAVMA